MDVQQASQIWDSATDVNYDNLIDLDKVIDIFAVASKKDGPEACHIQLDHEAPWLKYVNESM